MKPGSLYLFKPFQLLYNPEHHRPPMVGIFLEHVKDPSGWTPSRLKILGPNGVEHLWSNRWAVEEEL